MTDSQTLTVDERLHRIERLIAMQTMDMWSASDLAIVLDCSVKHIYNMVSKKELPYYKSGKLMFKRQEIEAHYAANRIATNAELLSEAVTYTRLHKLK